MPLLYYGTGRDPSGGNSETALPARFDGACQGCERRESLQSTRTLLRNSDRVHVGCLAQLVNVIAPLVTNSSAVLRQSTYFPYAWALRYARGRVLDFRVESDTYPISAAGLQADFARNGDVPFVDIVATLRAS